MATNKTSTPVAVKSSDEDKWRAEDDMRTLARAEEVKRDPQRLAAAKRCAKERLTEMQAVASMPAK